MPPSDSTTARMPLRDQLAADLRADHLDPAVLHVRAERLRGSSGPRPLPAASPPVWRSTRISTSRSLPKSCSATSPRFSAPSALRIWARSAGLRRAHLDQDAAGEVDAEIQAARGDRDDRDHAQRDRQREAQLVKPEIIQLRDVLEEADRAHGQIGSCFRPAPVRARSTISRRVTVTAVNIEQRMPMASVTPKPRTGPEPNA